VSPAVMEMLFEEERGAKGVWCLWKTLAAKKKEGVGNGKFGYDY
jgi:hypothetical protein